MGLLSGLPAGTPVAYEAAYGWSWLLELLFAAGCFWGVEAAFRQIHRCCILLRATPAAASPTPATNGSAGTAPATPRRSRCGSTRPSYAELLQRFWRIHHPTTRNHQGFDFGSQYRSAIFYHEAGQMEAALASRDRRCCLRVRPGRTYRRSPLRTAYQPGEFYLRELSLLYAVLDGLSRLGLLVVDGYADLNLGGRPSLGAQAHAAFGIPVIGVAKTQFRTATHAVPVVRGSAVPPLFVTPTGTPGAGAADLVRRMAGRYRLPDTLSRADTLARTESPSLRTTDRPPD